MTAVESGRFMSAARTDVGKVRVCNEDAVFRGSRIWAVADGMGGHAAGDVASSLAVEMIRDLDLQTLVEVDDVKACIERINDRILAYGVEHPESSGLGSTLTGVAEVTVNGAAHWAVFNIGDSRVYRLANGRLSRATVDHSEVEDLVLGGLITEEQARSHSSRNVITRSLGSNPAPQPDVWLLPQGSDETYLVCSDGLTNELTDNILESVLANSDSPEDCVNELIELALRNGARDNVSAVVVTLHDEDSVDERTIPRDDNVNGG